VATVAVATVAERREALTGFAVAVFRVDELVRAAARSVGADGLGLHVVDTTAPDSASMLLFDGGGARVMEAMGVAAPEGRFGLVQTSETVLGGRSWAVTVFAGDMFERAGRFLLPYAALAVGLIFTGMLAAYFAVVRGRGRRVEALVALRTVQLTQAQAQLERLAETDALTGLFNRRGIRRQAELELELARAEREKRSFSLTIADLNDFKQVNDTHGHNAGDDVLRGVAQALKEATRPYDSLGRWGGDEFLVVIPGATEREAMTVAARMEAAVSALRLASLGRTVPARISVGTATAVPGAGMSLDALIEQADASMYRAKRGRKDRAVERSGSRRVGVETS